MQPSDYFERKSPPPNHVANTLQPSYWALMFYPQKYNSEGIEGLNHFGRTTIAYPPINPALLLQLPTLNDEYEGQRDSSKLHQQFCTAGQSINIRQVNYHFFNEILDTISTVTAGVSFCNSCSAPPIFEAPANIQLSIFSGVG